MMPAVTPLMSPLERYVRYVARTPLSHVADTPMMMIVADSFTSPPTPPFDAPF